VVRGAYRVLVGNLREIEYLEDLSVDGMVILTWLFKKLFAGIDWIDLALGRDRWWTLVNAVMKIRLP